MPRMSQQEIQELIRQRNGRIQALEEALRRVCGVDQLPADLSRLESQTQLREQLNRATKERDELRAAQPSESSSDPDAKNGESEPSSEEGDELDREMGEARKILGEEA